ncbi:cytochrome P450 CYP749A22-like [Momordica charantia]|uniref:Cytochrome P450 CYP749A22-like n=1 Tax=Momordica charantia TaxID=3673 RepID=A0A6J1D5R3_MOMCH|nr:cytochrome P450 CYP749A22-like [Momordica charantia]
MGQVPQNSPFCFPWRQLESLKNMIPVMIGCAETMIEEWKHYEGKEVDVFEHFKMYTLDVISHTAFGSSYKQGKNIFQMLQKLWDLSVKNGYKVRPPRISKILKSKDDIEGECLEKSMKDCFMEIIQTREAKLMNGEAEDYGNDFLGLLVKAKNEAEESHRISMDDVVDECKTFYFAGHETTNVLLAWTMFLLALHKQWQDKARNEVLKIFGDKNPTSEGLPKNDDDDHQRISEAVPSSHDIITTSGERSEIGEPRASQSNSDRHPNACSSP